MEWGHPQNFIWFWLVFLAVLLFFLNGARKRARLSKFGEFLLIQKLTASFDPAKSLLKKALIVLAIFFMILALAQPHFRKKETLVERKGIDVMIVVDVSRSMLAKDILPNRLEKARLELATLIEKLRGNRIGIVAFAGDAMIQCPLTLDQNAAKLFLASLGPDLISYQGTSLTKAILVASQAFADKEKEHKAMILLTDGENHEPEAEKAADRAAKSGIRIFTIGIGTPDGATLPSEVQGGGYKKDREGKPILSKLNEALLKDIARRTEGRYYRASRGELEIEALARDINQIKQKSLKNEWSIEYEENFQFFVLAALLCLLLEMLISERKRISGRHE